MLVCNVLTCFCKASPGALDNSGGHYYQVHLALSFCCSLSTFIQLNERQTSAFKHCCLVLHPCHTETQLPSDAVALGSEMEFASGTTITVMEDSIVQPVDLEKQPHLVDQLAAL